MSVGLRPERDAQLLPLAAAGNVDSLGELYERHRDGAMAVAISVLADVADAEDVVQDVFVQLPRMARSYDPDRGEPAQWLLRSVRNRAIDHLRRRARQHHRIAPRTDQADLIEIIAAAGTSPSDQVEADEFLDLIGRVDARYAQLIRLAFVEGWSHSAIAGITGLPLGTVKSRIRVGLRLIRSLVSDMDVTPRGPEPGSSTRIGPLLIVTRDGAFGRKLGTLAGGLAPVSVHASLPTAFDPRPIGIILDTRATPAEIPALVQRQEALGWGDVPALAWGGRWKVRPLASPAQASGRSALARALMGSPAAAVNALLSAAADPAVHESAIDRLLAADGLAILRGDRLGRVTAASHGAAVLFGRGSRELVGSSVTELSAMPKGWTERQWQRLIADGWWTGSSMTRGTRGALLATGSVAWLVPSSGFLAAVVSLDS